MKTDKELLKLLLEFVRKNMSIFKYQYSGMCVCIHYLDITEKESLQLAFVLHSSPHPVREDAHWWMKFRKYPRVKWLKNRIKMCK